MINEQDVRRNNPKSSLELDAMKEALETLRKLQEAGIARGDTFRPVPTGRRSLEDLKGRRPMYGAFKLKYDT